MLNAGQRVMQACGSWSWGGNFIVGQQRGFTQRRWGEIQTRLATERSACRRPWASRAPSIHAPPRGSAGVEDEETPDVRRSISNKRTSEVARRRNRKVL
jgi:hypothetical protein